MAHDLDGILAVADGEIVLRSLLTEAERPLYYGHDGVTDWFDAVFGVFPDWSPQPRPAVPRRGRRRGDRPRRDRHRRRERRAGRPDYWLGARVEAAKITFFGFFRTEEDALDAVPRPHMIPPDTHIGKVRLRVADIDDLTTFYERVVGLQAVERDGDVVRLGPEGGEPLIELVGRRTRRRRRSFSTGLFHLAILVPDRAELARSLQRVAGRRLAAHRRVRPPR